MLWDRRNERHSGLEGGSANPRADLRWEEEFRLFVEADLVGDETPHPLAEAVAAWTPAPWLRVEAGLLRLALGTEAATREEDLPVPGLSFASHLDARTDLALRAAGSAAEGAVHGEVFAAAGHGFGPDGRSRTSPLLGGRLAVRPVRLLGEHGGAAGKALDAWFLGVGAEHLADFDDALVLQTPPGSTVFLTEDLGGGGGRWLHLDTGAAAGPVAAGLEVVRGAVYRVPGAGGGGFTADELTAWTGTLAVTLAGAPRRWRDGAWAAPEGGYAAGGWEIALRYSNGDMDRALFDEGITTYDPSSQEVRAFSAVLSWRPRPWARVSLGWVKTIADEELTVFGGEAGPRTVPRAAGDGRDSSFLLRFEVFF